MQLHFLLKRKSLGEMRRLPSEGEYMVHRSPARGNTEVATMERVVFRDGMLLRTACFHSEKEQTRGDLPRWLPPNSELTRTEEPIKFTVSSAARMGERRVPTSRIRSRESSDPLRSSNLPRRTPRKLRGRRRHSPTVSMRTLPVEIVALFTPCRESTIQRNAATSGKAKNSFKSCKRRDLESGTGNSRVCPMLLPC